MIKLLNKNCSVHILDPAADQTYFGSRYCTGGYIWQIFNRDAQPLLSGPRFPDHNPPQFDGQGAPEAFVTTLGESNVALGSLVTVIGVGTVIRSSETASFHPRYNPHVKEFCSWTVSSTVSSLFMKTTQRNDACSITLERQISLEGATVVSKTTIVNHCSQPLPIRWFAHPFFPVPADLRCCQFSLPWDISANDGYCKDTDATLCMKPGYPWDKGLFQQLALTGRCRLSARVFHPVCDFVDITTDYPLESLPVWANNAAFSPEPYFAPCIAAYERTEWEIHYRFGG